MEHLNSYLKVKAIELGLCKEWTEAWEPSHSYAELIDKYKRGIDFCIEHDYPSNEVIKAHFPEEELLFHHVYVDQIGVVDGHRSDTYVIQGSSKVTLEFHRYEVAMIYVRHASELNLIVGGHARVFVRLFDDASVSAEQMEQSHVFVRKASENAKVDYVGKITLKT